MMISGDQVVGGVDITSELSHLDDKEQTFNTLLKDVQEKVKKRPISYSFGSKFRMDPEVF